MATTKHRFTKDYLDAIPHPTAGRETYVDTKDTYLRLIVSRKAKTFYYVRKVKGETLYIKIGDRKNIDLKIARSISADKSAQVARGEDPRNAKVLPAAAAADPQADTSMPTLQAVWDQFLELHIDVNTKSGRPYRSKFKHVQRFTPKDMTVKMPQIPADQVSREQIAELKAYLTKKHSIYTANRVIQMLRSCFNWGIKTLASLKQIANPVSKPGLKKEPPRKRYLNEDECPAFFQALEEHGDQRTRDIVLMLLWTGQRLNNVLAMKWADIDMSAGTWAYAGSEAKNEDNMAVHLVKEAKEILTRRREQMDAALKVEWPNKKITRKQAQYVFPGRKGGSTGHVVNINRGWDEIRQRATEIGEQQQPQQKLGDLHLHDLRRTMGTWLINNDVPLAVVSKILGHKDIETTRRAYAHVLDKTAAVAVDLAVEKLTAAAGLAIPQP